MPAAARPGRQPTDDWQQLRLLVTSSEQAAYELVRPIVLFGQLPRELAHETGVSERTLQRKVARFAAAGMRSLFEPDDPPAADQRSLPLGIRKAIVELKAEYPPLSLHQIATICEHRFDRPVSHHTVERVLATEPLPLHPPRRRSPRRPNARTSKTADLLEPLSDCGPASPPTSGLDQHRRR